MATLDDQDLVIDGALSMDDMTKNPSLEGSAPVTEESIQKTDVQTRHTDASHDIDRASDIAWRSIDRGFRARIGRFTGGISPVGLSEAYFDWIGHLWMSPGKQAQLVDKAWRKATLYRAASAGRPLRCRGVAAVAVQIDLSELLIASAMVA